MAKTSKNILGDQSGKIGKVVGRVVNGVQLYSAYNNHNSNPRTPKQLAARARFKAVMRIAKPLNGVINIGLRLAAAGIPMTSPSNIFTRRNNRLMQYDAESGVATPDYENLILSEGRTPYVDFGTASFAEAKTVKVPVSSSLDSEFVLSMTTPSISPSIVPTATSAPSVPPNEQIPRSLYRCLPAG